MVIPTLETERLKLVPPAAHGFEAYREFYTDAAASNTYGGPLSPSQAWTRLKSDLGSWYLSGFGVWMLELNSTGEIVGTCGFWQGLGWPRELTWWLLPEARGQGYAFEASGAAISYAYDAMGWEDVVTYMLDSNIEASRLVERLGGEKARRMEFPDGQLRDYYRLPRPVSSN